MKHSLPKQNGFSLISAIFLVVVLAMLGSFMVTLSTVQHSSSALAVQSARAWYAALSGMEWAVYELKSTGAAGTGCTSLGSSFTVNGFAINTTCTVSSPIVEGADPTYYLYDVRLTASRGTVGSYDFVTNDLRATIKVP